MGSFTYLTGDLVSLAETDDFDLIVIGGNCNFKRDSALAKGISYVFGVPTPGYPNARIEELGNVLYFSSPHSDHTTQLAEAIVLSNSNLDSKPFDYSAYTLCMKKINHRFKGKHIGLPKIGCHLAGADWEILEVITRKQLEDCDVTIVEYGG